MKTDKEQYIEEYIRLSGFLAKKPSDYTKKTTKKHNKAMKQLLLLEKDLSKNLQLATEVYSILLNNEDLYIKQSAATECLDLRICVDQSIEVLEYIRQNGERMASMGADRILRIWRGELDPSKPF